MVTRLSAAFPSVHLPGERLRSNLSRLVVTVWVFVVLIFVSTYTASLASMLTAQRLQPSTLEGLFGQLNFDPSKLRAYGSPEEYEDALSKEGRNGGVSAIFDEMPYLRIFLVFSKGSGLAADASRAILEATESGLMAQLEKKWFGDEISCRLKNSVAEFHRLSFKSFSGLFIVSGAVSAAAVLVFLGRYVCRNWDELRTLSSGRPFPKRVVAWARHYVRMEPTSVSGVDESAALGRSGAAWRRREEAAYPRRPLQPPGSCIFDIVIVYNLNILRKNFLTFLNDNLIIDIMRSFIL
ncbi:unnamed protein product [Spirodela intermedia]|uniref:Ionotropic glutamate receptor C-terminal domain-containing protein n=1 Tax=Spirodela intermedia TaxID=51605 RepID=A0ABN7E9F9_SPIIN|nr:unnamed protein product [Spirodela intermedia]